MNKELDPNLNDYEEEKQLEGLDGLEDETEPGFGEPNGVPDENYRPEQKQVPEPKEPVSANGDTPANSNSVSSPPPNQPSNFDPKKIRPVDGNKPAEAKEGFKPAGGPDIKPSTKTPSTGSGKAETAKMIANVAKNGLPTSKEGVEQLATEAGGKAINVAARAAMVASGAGAALSGFVGNLAEKAAKKLIPLQKKLAPAMGVMLVVMAVGTLMIVGEGIGIAASFSKGILGKSEAQPASAGDMTDINNINEILGAKQSLANLKSWYFSQGTEPWGPMHHFSGDTCWGDSSTFANTGCALTSGSMIAKYYGVSTCDPLRFAKFIFSYNGNSSMAMSAEGLERYLNVAGLNKKLVTVPKSVQAIRAEIAAGNPVLAQGYGAFGAGHSYQHWVVIAGVSEDGKHFILNDPGVGFGGSGKPSLTSELTRSSAPYINGVWAFHDK